MLVLRFCSTLGICERYRSADSFLSLIFVIYIDIILTIFLCYVCAVVLCKWYCIAVLGSLWDICLYIYICIHM